MVNLQKRTKEPDERYKRDFADYWRAALDYLSLITRRILVWGLMSPVALAIIDDKSNIPAKVDERRFEADRQS